MKENEITAPPPLVLDSGAVLAYLWDEDGAAVVEQLCVDNPGRVFMHVINAGEVFYWMRREHGEEAAQRAIEQLDGMGVTLRADMDGPFWQDAMRLKADHHRVSLADCYLLALARRLAGEAVTTDHHEMDPLVPLNLCTIRFVR